MSGSPVTRDSETGEVLEFAHKNLAEALVAFQAEAPTLTKDSTNPHFRSRFVSLDNIVETVRPLLAKHGLAWSTLPCFGPNGEPALRYQLLHAPTGEALSETMPLLLAKQDPQGQGSALTYGRRYSISAVLNLVADDDDDGNAASQRQRVQRTNGSAPQTTAQPAEHSQPAATANQKGKINALFGQVGLSENEAKAVLQWVCGTAVLDRVTKQNASKLIELLGEDGSGQEEILNEIGAEAGAGDQRAQKISERYLAEAPNVA